MSREQLEQVKALGNTLMKVLLGISGAALTMLYYTQRNETDEFRNEVKKSFMEIRASAVETKSSMEQIKSDVRLIDYRLKQIEADE